MISSNAINHQPLVVTVVVGTDAQRVVRDYPTNVRASARETGLPKDTVFLCFQIRSLDPVRFVDPRTQIPNLAGRMPPDRMSEIENAIRLVLEL